MRREYYILKIYRNIFLVATLIIGLQTIFNRQMYGEGVGVTLALDNIDICVLIILQCITIYSSFLLFIKTKDYEIALDNKRIQFTVDKRKIHIFILLLLVLQIIFSLKTGNGVIGHTSTATGSISQYLLNMMKVTQFMPIYYIVARDTTKKIYWSNIILWLTYSIVCGWTGTILEIAFLEMFLRVKNKNYGLFIQLGYKLSGVATFVAMLIGGYIYKYMYVIKNYIRYGYNIGKLSFMEGLEKLISRFTNFPLAIVAIQNNSAISNLYNQQAIGLVDIKAVFRPILPGFIMHNKGFRTLNNLIIQSMYPDVLNTTSSDYCIWLFLKNLYSANIIDFFLYILVVFIFMIISKEVIYSFDDGSRNIEILYFFLLLKFINGNSAETMFGYGYISLVYLLPIMIILGIIKMNLCVSEKH